MNLNQVDLNKLHVFTIVAQARSMTSAAQTLLRTPSAVSQSISALEKTLGVRLFKRVGTRLYLTREGEELHRGLHRYQADLANLLTRIPYQQNQISGEARLGLLTGFSALGLGDTLAKLLKEHEGMTVRFKVAMHAELSEALMQDQIDLALSIIPLKRFRRSIESRKLLREELVLVSGAESGLRLSRNVDFEKIPVVEYFHSPSLYRHWVRYQTGRMPRNANVRAYASTLDYVIELTRKGVGFAVVPGSVARSHDSLVSHAISGTTPLVSTVWLNRVKGGHLSSPGEKLEEALIKGLR